MDSTVGFVDENRKHIVIAIDEDGSMSVYGPYSEEYAREAAELISIYDSGDTDTTVRVLGEAWVGPESDDS